MPTRTTRAAFAGALVLTTLATAGVTTARAAPTQAVSEEFVVLSADETSVAAAQAVVEAAGGTVKSVNTDVGLLTVETSNAGFAAAVSADAAVAGVAHNRPIGFAPSTGRKARWEDVEKATEDRGRAQQGGDDPADDGEGEPLAGRQWDMRMIHATEDGSYAVNPGNAGVTVGIIDTGVDGSHPDIAPNFNSDLSRNFTTDIEDVDGPCADEPDGSCEDPADVDENGHGTHVAGTIGSPLNGLGIGGVAPNVTLVNLRAGQDSGFFFLGPTVDAYTYAGNNGIDVVNMSYFTDPWLYNCAANPADSPEQQAEQRTIIEASQRALRFARRHGVTLVSAIGNGHTDLGNPTIDVISPDYPIGTEYPREIDNSCLTVPTELDGVVSISALGPSGNKADYSDYGIEQTDFSAPGGFFRDFFGTDRFMTARNMILAPYPLNVAMVEGLVDPVSGQPGPGGFVIADCTGATIDTCTYWQYIQGTSMASPHAAGVAALVVSAHGTEDAVHGGLTMAPGEVERVMRKTATDTPCPAENPVDYLDEGRDDTYTAFCEGLPWKNGFYGHGIVNALGAVK
ncbi:MAG TPA: S8 family serine peptidase [Acidimicrobiales bacterium]|nr:S8 family serine peptidase [Acidimicrobiales bacterium]